MPEREALPTVDKYGRTIIYKSFGSVTVQSRVYANGNFIKFPSEANKSAAAGAATHGFFYHITDFLQEVVEIYSTLGDNEIFSSRQIYDSNFINDVLEFITNGNYTENDVKVMKYQIEGIVFELAKQIKDGKNEINLNSVNTRLTIGGAKIGISQLFEFQKIGKSLESVLNQTFVGQMDSFRYAQKGLAKSIGEYYGKAYGEVDSMFSNGIAKLYEKV